MNVIHFEVLKYCLEIHVDGGGGGRTFGRGGGALFGGGGGGTFCAPPNGGEETFGAFFCIIIFSKSAFISSKVAKLSCNMSVGDFSGIAGSTSSLQTNSSFLKLNLLQQYDNIR